MERRLWAVGVAAGLARWQYRWGAIQKGVMPVARDRKPAPVLITDAPEDPEREQRRREIRYVIMMSIRAACLVAGAIIVSTKPPLWGLWVVLAVAGMVVIPWLAVIMANDRRPQRRGHVPAPQPASQPALPAPRDDRVIDA